MFVCGIVDDPGSGRCGIIHWVRRLEPMASAQIGQIKQEPVEEDNDIKNGDGGGGAEAASGQQQSENTLKDEGCQGEEDTPATLEQLIAENKRLKDLHEKMNARQTVLEEFIEVEYGERFDGFLKNRARLVNVMGLGESSTEDGFDGSRSAKSHELVKLLKVVKDQAAANVSPSSTQPTNSSPSNRYQPYNSRGGGGGNQRPWNKNKRGGGGGIGRY